MKFNIDTCDRICGNRYFPLTFVAIAAIFLLLCSMATSPLFGLGLVDASVFKMMGHVLLSGGVPYVDYFDHKGPYFYLINAIGESIDPRWGIYPLQVIWLSISLILCQKIACLFVRPTYSFVILLITVLILTFLVDNGDVIEEWSLLPCSLCVYLALSFLVNHSAERHGYWRSLVYGLCFGFVFLVRPNDAVMVCGGVMMGIFLYISFRQKRYANAFVNGLVFILGAAVMAAPWIAYFAYHHALGDFWFGLIGFNMHYTGGILAALKETGEIKVLVILCILLIALAIAVKKRRLLWMVVPISVFIVLLFGRCGYNHYYITVIPAIVLPFLAMLFCLKVRKSVVIIAGLLLLVLGIMSIGTERIKRISSHLAEGTLGREFFAEKQKFDKDKDLLLVVPEAERDSIWNYGDEFSTLFYLAGLIAQNPVPPGIAGQHRPFPKEKEKMLHVTQNRPLWIVMRDSSGYLFPQDSVFIAENYALVKESESKIYQLLKRKR